MRFAAAILVVSIVVGGAALASAPSRAQTAMRARVRPVALLTTEAPKPTATPALPVPQGRLTLRGLPDRADPAPACRAQCAKTRLTCEAVAETCAPAWSACLRRCNAA